MELCRLYAHAEEYLGTPPLENAVKEDSCLANIEFAFRQHQLEIEALLHRLEAARPRPALRGPMNRELAAKRNDQVARVVAWFDASLFDERRAIAYIWDSSAPAGTIIRDRGPHAERALEVVWSGSSGLGAWHRETRHVYQDYRDIFRDEPTQLLAITLESHSDDVASQSAVLFGKVRFQARSRGCLDLMGPAVEPLAPVDSMPG